MNGKYFLLFFSSKNAKKNDKTNKIELTTMAFYQSYMSLVFFLVQNYLLLFHIHIHGSLEPDLVALGWP